MNELAHTDSPDVSKSDKKIPQAANVDAGTTSPDTNKERFIPISRFAVLDRVGREDVWAPAELGDARTVMNHLAAWRHLEYHDLLMQLKEAYLPFSPDRDTLQILNYSSSELKQKKKKLVEALRETVTKANYTEITQEEIIDYFESKSPYGLDLTVDLSEFDELLLFSRGSSVRTYLKRDWRWLFLRRRRIDEPIFQRLFLLIKLKPVSQRLDEIMSSESCDEDKAKKILGKKRRNIPEHASSDHIYLKLFKNINKSDLEMLFPNTEVEFKLFDKIRLGVTAGGGTIASVVGTATKILAAANPIALAGAIFGLLTVIFRQVMGFFNQRTKYMMVLAQNLYFHNLANNRGVLTLLSDRAEEEDIKEELLLYTYLCQYEVPQRQLGLAKLAIENYIKSEFGVNVCFDIEDALDRLTRDGLVVTGPDNNLKSLPPHEAIKILEKAWMKSIRPMPWTDASHQIRTTEGQNVLEQHSSAQPLN